MLPDMKSNAPPIPMASFTPWRDLRFLSIHFSWDGAPYATSRMSVFAALIFLMISFSSRFSGVPS